MARYTIFFNDLKEEVQENLKSQLREEIMSDKEVEWSGEWNQERKEHEANFSEGEAIDGFIEEDDYVDQKRDEFDLEAAVDDYVSNNDLGVDYDI
jgi:hypothetical protein